MKLVNVTIVANDGKKGSRIPAGKKVDLFPLETVKNHIAAVGSMIDFDDLANDLKKINQNTTYTFAHDGHTVTAQLGDLKVKGKMKLAWLGDDGISFHNLKVYEYKGQLHGLDKDFDKLYEE